MTKGWRSESVRHSLARKGIKTRHKHTPFAHMPKYEQFPLETAIYVPSTTKILNLSGKETEVQVPAEEFNERVDEARLELSTLFNGYTSVEAIGGFVNPDTKQLSKEPVTKITAFTTAKKFKEKRKEYLDWIEKKRTQWNQNSIGFEHRNKLYWLH